MRVRRSTWIGSAFGAAVLVGLTGWAFHARPEVQIERAEVTAGAITRRVVATGTVQPVTAVQVGTQVSGRVQSLEADFNSIVHAGQVIARLDSSLYEAALEQARAGQRLADAEFLQAQADLMGLRTGEDDARTKLARAQQLAASQLIPNADLDAARIAMDEASADVRSGEARITQAEAALAQAKAGVDQASIDLDHTIIRSPIDGIVVARNVDVGQTLAASVQAPVLFSIASDFKRVQLQADVDESDIDGLTAGEPASFQVASYPGETFHGSVTQLRPQAVAEETATVVSYTAIIDVANPDERLRPGMTAEVALRGARRDNAVRIPNSALAFRPPPDVLKALGEAEPSIKDGVEVWEYDGQMFTPIAVHTGLADDTWTELVDGSLRPGDALVTRATLRTRPL
jgi:HlyD family secretion protein